ncbi:MAG: patatin-like phospholipase family protein [Alcanivoracaceae bacterium]|nr:patatin-like phospholipase family protein [Alcanivoracaceae bacterium]
MPDAHRVLHIRAGDEARQQLRDGPLRQQDIGMMLGASGGPKWLALYGLDRYLFGHFFRYRQTPLQVLGSSAGAWRFACFAQTDPVAATERFARGYIDAAFPRGMSVADITQASKTLLHTVMDSQQHAAEILANPVVRLNLVVARARAITAARHPGAQMAGLALAASANALSRRLLGAFFERVIFHRDSASPFAGLNDLPTRHVPLTGNNLHDAVLASGSIPMVLDAVENIAGAGPGRYFDGGVTDYHFDLPLPGDALVLYPHFYSHAIPGWFDKSLPWRRAGGSHYQRVVMVSPSPEWVDSLPHGKIPDRKDFARLDDDDRRRYWNRTLEHSLQLADAFDRFVQQPAAFAIDGF